MTQIVPTIHRMLPKIVGHAVHDAIKRSGRKANLKNFASAGLNVLLATRKRSRSVTRKSWR